MKFKKLFTTSLLLTFLVLTACSGKTKETEFTKTDPQTKEIMSVTLKEDSKEKVLSYKFKEFVNIKEGEDPKVREEQNKEALVMMTAVTGIAPTPNFKFNEKDRVLETSLEIDLSKLNKEVKQIEAILKTMTKEDISIKDAKKVKELLIKAGFQEVKK